MSVGHGHSRTVSEGAVGDNPFSGFPELIDQPRRLLS